MNTHAGADPGFSEMGARKFKEKGWSAVPEAIKSCIAKTPTSYTLSICLSNSLTTLE